MTKTLTTISPTKSLVDLVEQRLTEYFQENELKPGSPIPREIELSQKLGVGRSVVREALSRFRMLGIIESRTKRGMILLKPQLFPGMKKVIDLELFSREDLFNIIDFRTSLEIGIAYDVVNNIDNNSLLRLKEIALAEKIKRENNIPSNEEDYMFHTELHRIAGNVIIQQFYDNILPVLRKADELIITYTSNEMLDIIYKNSKNKSASHDDILQALIDRDPAALQEILRNHLNPYKNLLKESLEMETRASKRTKSQFARNHKVKA